MRSKSILVLGTVFGLVFFGVVTQKAVAVITFDDGGVHNIDYVVNDNVWVDWNAPGMRTTINWLDGGVLSGSCYLVGYEDSVLNVSGGSIGYGLILIQNSKANVTGGSMPYLTTNHDSQVTFSGGLITGELNTRDNTQVNISGGSVVHHLYAQDNSRVIISGGFTGTMMSAGGNQWSTSTIEIIGSDFAVNGVSIGYGVIDRGGWDSVSGSLSGMLANGDLFECAMNIRGDSKIVLAPIPAPGALMLGMIGVGFVGWLRRIDVRKKMW